MKQLLDVKTNAKRNCKFISLQNPGRNTDEVSSTIKYANAVLESLNSKWRIIGFDWHLNGHLLHFEAIPSVPR